MALGVATRVAVAVGDNVRAEGARVADEVGEAVAMEVGVGVNP